MNLTTEERREQIVFEAHREKFYREMTKGVPPGALVRNLFARASASITVQAIVDLRDLSKWDNLRQSTGVIDFDGLKRDGTEAVIIKLTEGGTGVDPYGDGNVRGAFGADLLVMVYHFMRANVGATAQYDNIMRALNPLANLWDYKILVFLDEETEDGVDQTTRIRRFTNVGQKVIDAGLLAGVYSSPGFWNAHMTPTPAIVGQMAKWVAHWTSASAPILPSGWSGWSFWQKGISNKHSWIPPTPSVSGAVDYNEFNGTFADLQSLLGVQTTPPPGTHVHPEFSQLAALISQNSTDISGLVSQVSALDQTLTQITGQVGTLDSKVKILDNQVGAVQADLATERGRIDDLLRRMAAVELKIKDVRSAWLK